MSSNAEKSFCSQKNEKVTKYGPKKILLGTTSKSENRRWNGFAMQKK
jgi:hypothetical protein